MADREREQVPVEHDLPDDLRAAVADETETLAALYNDLQDLSGEAFEARFGDSLADIRAVARDADADLVLFVVGLSVGDRVEETGDLVDGAALVTGHVPRSDGGVTDLLYRDPDAEALDYFVLLPVRPEDCPPGSGQAAADLDPDTYREVVSAMLYRRFDLLQNDPDRYAASYVRPLVRGLEAFDEAR